MPEAFANDARTTLSAAISSTSATSISVTSAAGFPASGNYRIRIDDEFLLVTGGQGTTTWTVTRAVEDASRFPATTHANGAVVSQVMTVGGLDQKITDRMGPGFFIAPLSGMYHGGYGTVGASNNAIFRPVWIPVNCTVTGVRMRIGTASGNICVGLYDAAGNRLATSGSVACPAAGFATVSFTASYAATPGGYFIAVAADNTTATFSAGGGGAGTAWAAGALSAGSAMPLPATFTPGGEIDSAQNVFNIVAVVTGGWP